jgi:hypothetical protein
MLRGEMQVKSSAAIVSKGTVPHDSSGIAVFGTDRGEKAGAILRFSIGTHSILVQIEAFKKSDSEKANSAA